MAIDFTSRAKMQDVSISVLAAKDSILQKFSYTNADGFFRLSGLPDGDLIVLVSYPDYADYTEKFMIDDQSLLRDFGTITLKLKSTLLKEVMIKGEVIGMRQKGDTTEFNAKAYVIQPNDKVEDLLKQLPGIQVDSRGKITANGEIVTKVLLDGEEFFGDDPTLVTRNIRADMVAKVQLYNKKSDQATFTGINDGVKTKTINIVLKEDKKTGTFGKASAGIGNRGLYEGQAIYNRFVQNKKISAFGNLANDGKTGLGSADNTKTGFSNVRVNSGSLVSTASGNDALETFSGTYDGRGYPKSRSGGFHYDDKWDQTKKTFNTNYLIGSMEVSGVNTSLTQQTLPGNTLTDNTVENYDNYAFRQKLDATYLVKLDSTANLRLKILGATKNFRVNNDFLRTTGSVAAALINRQKRVVSNAGDQADLGANLYYTKKFKKARRTFSWNSDVYYTRNQTKGNINSVIAFFDPQGAVDSTETVDQYKTTDINNFSTGNSFTYTEPISKPLSLSLNYSLGVSKSDADRRSFNKGPSGAYTLADAAYSNDYQFDQLSNRFGAGLTYSAGKSLITLENQIANVNFEQKDRLGNTVFKRRFFNWSPHGLFSYQITPQQEFFINYSGGFNQPTVEQIQPVRANTDPLNIVIGNPALSPSFTNSFQIYYRAVSLVHNQSVLIQGDYGFTSDAISNSISSDPLSGKSVLQYVNIGNGKPTNYRGFADFNKKLSFQGLSLDLTADMTGNVYYSIINSALNRSGSYSYSVNLSVNKSVANKYDLSLGGGLNYLVNEFSVMSASNNNSRGANARASFRYFLPLKFQVSSNFGYTYVGRTQVFDAQRRNILNSAISKTFLKGDNLKLSINGYDLLDQNSVFSRTVFGNSITQSNIANIRRYFMLSLSWDFTKFKMIATNK